MQNQTEPMDASKQFCPNMACPARGKIGAGNIRIHSYKPARYRCHRCKRTFSARHGTMMEGLRTPTELVMIVVTLLAYGCPAQAIVHAYGVDERTVAAWRDRALADRLLRQVCACCLPLRALLVCTDGWAAYPNSIMRAFRAKVKKTVGRGRACLEIWPDLCIATVIKRAEKKRVVEVTRKMTLGSLELANKLLQATQGGAVLNTAFIERFNGTMRQRLASLTRKCRHAAHRIAALSTGMYLIGCTYNFCFPHHELSKAKHFGYPSTPAMASGLTDHVWTLQELVLHKVAPTAWVEPRRPGRPGKRAGANPPLPKRPRGRPRIHPLPDPTVPKRPRGRPRKVARACSPTSRAYRSSRVHATFGI